MFFCSICATRVPFDLLPCSPLLSTRCCCESQLSSATPLRKQNLLIGQRHLWRMRSLSLYALQHNMSETRTTGLRIVFRLVGVAKKICSSQENTF